MNVIDLLNDRSIKYRESGKDYLVHCINPEHDDSNPSMRIDKVTGIFNCLSCGHKGNIFKVFGAEPNKIDQKIAYLQKKIIDTLSSARLDMPMDAVPFCRDYRNISAHTYMLVNAFLSSEQEEFKDRLMFPLYDIRGSIRVFLGRSLHSDVEDKYLFYPKHIKPPLFPANPEIYKNTLIIVEGIFDALNLIDKGCHNVICAFGTTSLHKQFADKLAHYKILGVNKFYIMFDGDESGNREGAKLEKIMNSNGFNAEQIEMPEGVDPGDLTEKDITTLMLGLYGKENSSS